MKGSPYPILPGWAGTLLDSSETKQLANYYYYYYHYCYYYYYYYYYSYYYSYSYSY